jgi:O-antigen/teichoic acid export membrane protein
VCRGPPPSLRCLSCAGAVTRAARRDGRAMRGPGISAAFRGVASIVSGSVAGQALTILAYPLLTRLYTPAEFGLLTVFTAVVSMVAVTSTATLEAAVPIPVEDRDAAAVAWAGLASVGVVSVSMGLVGLVAAAPLADLLGVPPLADLWWLAALTVGVLGCYAVLSEWMIRGRSYGALGRRNLLQGVGQVGTQAGLGLTGSGSIGLLLGLAVGRLLAIGGLLSRRGLLRQPRPRLSVIRTVLRRFRRFPQMALPSALLNSAGLELPFLLVAAMYGDIRAGLLGLAVRVIGGPSTILGQAVSQVFTGESSALLRGRRGGLRKSIRRSVLRMLAVGAVPAALLVAAGPALFGAVFGSEWVEAGEFARYLAVGYLAQFAVTPVSASLWLLERQGLELGWVAFRLLMTAGAPTACWALDAPISAAIIALSAAQVVSYLLLYRLCIQATTSAEGQPRETA